MLNNPVLALSADNGAQRSKLPVIGSSGVNSVSGNYTIGSSVGDLPILGRELFITNDNNTSMSVVITCQDGTLSFQIQSGEQFDERLPLFSQVVVTATGAWRWRVRGNIS